MSSALSEVKDNCRMCLLELKEGFNKIIIDDEIAKNFLELMRIPLTLSEKYSSWICGLCYDKLEDFLNFQCTMIANQRSLYQLETDSGDAREDLIVEPASLQIPEIKLEDPVWIKSEPLDFESYINQYVEKTSDFPSTSQNRKRSNPTDEFRTDKRMRLTSRATKFSVINEDHAKSLDIPDNHRLCSYCADIIPSKRFHSHMKKHKVEVNDLIYQCDNCDYKTRSKGTMARHGETHFGVRKQHNCSFCSKVFLRASYRDFHEKSSHLKAYGEHVCFCGKSYPSKSGLNNHRDKVHRSIIFPCAKCDRSFNSRNDLSAHNIRSHKPKIACEVCGLLKAPGVSYTLHLRTHTIEFHCGFEGCDKKFKYKNSRDYHFESEHKTPDGLKCPTCNAVFKMKRQLQRHIKRQHESSTMTCDIPGCNYTFKRKEYIARHITNHRDIDDKVKHDMLQELKTKFKFS